MNHASPQVLVLIPAFNEEERLADVLGRIANTDLRCRVLVVDDASTDDTGKVARDCGAVVLRHRVNLGYGGALQTGYKYALREGFRLLVQLDADGQHDPSLLPDLIEPIQNGEADIVIGSRFLEPTGYKMGALRSFGRKAIQMIASISGLKVSDPTSGLQAMTQDVIELFANDFYPVDYPDIDVLIIASNHGLRISEVSVQMSASPRPSTLHGGLRSVWYAYKMSLSIFAASGDRPPGSRKRNEGN